LLTFHILEQLIDTHLLGSKFVQAKHSSDYGKEENRERGQSPKKENWPSGTTMPVESNPDTNEVVSTETSPKTRTK